LIIKQSTIIVYFTIVFDFIKIKFSFILNVFIIIFLIIQPFIKFVFIELTIKF